MQSNQPSSCFCRIRPCWILLLLTAAQAVSAPAGEEKPAEEWKRSNPDVVVYLPKGGEAHDGDNEMLLVFKAPKGDELIAIWTQSSVEAFGDNRQMLSRSAEQESVRGSKWIMRAR